MPGSLLENPGGRHHASRVARGMKSELFAFHSAPLIIASVRGKGDGAPETTQFLKTPSSPFSPSTKGAPSDGFMSPSLSKQQVDRDPQLSIRNEARLYSVQFRCPSAADCLGHSPEVFCPLSAPAVPSLFSNPTAARLCAAGWGEDPLHQRPPRRSLDLYLLLSPYARGSLHVSWWRPSHPVSQPDVHLQLVPGTPPTRSIGREAAALPAIMLRARLRRSASQR